MGEEIKIDVHYVQGIIDQINAYQREVVRSLNYSIQTLNQSGKSWNDGQKKITATNLSNVVESTKVGVNALKSYNEELERRKNRFTNG